MIVIALIMTLMQIMHTFELHMKSLEKEEVNARFEGMCIAQYVHNG
jgi:hypothetical protein